MTAIDRENLRRVAQFSKLKEQFALADPDALIALLDRLEALEKALDGAAYDLERIEMADWQEEQFRFAAQVGARKARDALAKLDGGRG